MISALVHANSNGVERSFMENLGFAFTMVTGGNDTTTGLLGGTAELLTRHLAQRQQLAKDPGSIPVAVEEPLRRIDGLFVDQAITVLIDTISELLGIRMHIVIRVVAIGIIRDLVSGRITGG